jgi:hypothetical protein
LNESLNQLDFRSDTENHGNETLISTSKGDALTTRNIRRYKNRGGSVSAVKPSLGLLSPTTSKGDIMDVKPDIKKRFQ